MKLSAFRADRLLPLACLLAAGVLFASELMTMFDLTPAGGEVQQTLSNHMRHGNAMFVIAGFAILLVIVAVSAGSRPAALGVAVMGVIALVWFLIGDLPKAGQVGTLNSAGGQFLDAEAVPQAGFWLEMISAIGLAISGVALATLSSEQLMALRPGYKGEGTAATGKDEAKKPPARKRTTTKKSSSNGSESSKSNTSTTSTTAKTTSKKAPAPKRT